MKRQLVARVIVACVIAVGFTLIATPAFAQLGTLRGKVVDADGKPVPDAEMVFDYVGGYKIRFTVKTNQRGEWLRGGLQATSDGHWVITVTKGDLGGRFQAKASIGEVIDVPDMVIRPGGAKAESPTEAKEVAANRAMAAAIDKSFAEAKAALDANNFDAAITTLTATTTAYPTCAQCFANLGQAYFRKKDYENAEKFYLKAVEVDPKLASPYDLLATLYNQQKKFEEAGKMSAKASELHGASGGGGDAVSSYNAGVISWNQGNMAQAKAQFERALQLNPKMAEAHYYFGMALVNEGKIPEAKKALEQYLILAPTGPNAETAKAVVAELK